MISTAHNAAFKALVKDALATRAEDLFELVWGQPHRRGGHEWRPTAGSGRAMEMRGRKRGLWHDHSAGVGGDLLDLIAVEFCGLEKARDDFPRVLKEAANWCGVNQDSEIDLEPLKQRQRDLKAAAEIEEKAELETKAATLAHIIENAQAAQNSPAAAYLAGRGISQLPSEGLAFLPPIGARKHILHGNMAACVVWAQDSQGNLMGGQRILLNADGTRPKHLAASKPTFPKAHGYPARFAARASDGPLCIAEGPESALSIWLATGFETWAVFGASNWQAAPIPLGRKVILCPDRDAPDSQAATAFDTAAQHHADRGCNLHIAPAPEPESSKCDLNDTLQRAGLQAVRDAITAAKPFAGPPPTPKRIELPKAVELNSGRKVDMLAMLQGSTAKDALPLAVAVAHKLQARAPLIYTPRDVVQTITDSLPTDTLTAPQIDALQARVEWLQKKRRDDVMLRTQIARDSFATHDVKQIESLAEIDVTGWRGVMAIKAPMAAGKTQLAGHPFVQDAQANGKSVMAIAHRTTLIGELSQRLGLPDYRDLATNELAEKRACAVCLPSTTRGDIAEAMPAPECLFIDEIAQVLQFLAEPICSSGMKNHRGVYERLLQLVRDAKAVVVADADLDARTIAFLEKARPGERFTIVEVTAKPTDKTALVTGDTGKVLDAIAIELEAGGKAWLACEGKVKARAFAGHFEALGYKVICITADTKLDPAPRDFLRNPDAISREYDLVISSPAISSGLSIEHKGQPHFTLGAYIGAGTATRPEDAKQQLGRVRYLTRFMIGLDYSNLSGGQTVAGYREGIEGAAQIEKLALSWTDFDTYCTDIKAEAENAKADFAAGLWWLLEAAGWKLERPESPEDQAGRKLVKEVTTAAKEHRCAAILAAPIVDSHQAGLLENMARDSEQEMRRTAHTIRTALGKLDLTAADVAFWNEGQGRSTIERFEDLIGAEVNLAPASDVLSANKFRITRRRLFSILFDGINLNGTITQADAETILDRVMERPAVFVAARIVGSKYRAQFRGKGGKLTPVKRPKQAGRELTEILKRCGLFLSRKKAHSAPKPSSTNTKGESFGAITKCVTSWTVKPESMAYMAAILDRRDGFEIDEAIARADRSHAAPPEELGGFDRITRKLSADLGPPLCEWPRRMVIQTYYSEGKAAHPPPQSAGVVP